MENKLITMFLAGVIATSMFCSYSAYGFDMKMSASGDGMSGDNMTKSMPQKNMMKNNSPLKQFQSGVSIKNIQCKQGHRLIIESQGGFPTCVTPSTAVKLLALGWGHTP